ncbi:MAG: OmpA family protein, partial [Gemmatimonadetes bacterium]|nr:OmpA family protein [Gemmatimonadota bacterium]
APEVRTVVLDHVTFETSKAVLRPDGRKIVRRVADGLLADPTATASIIGHTDIRRIVHAPFDDNYHLSLERAKSVRRALIEMGVNSSRLTASGFGPDRPVADGRSPEALQKNRRVEITIRSDAGRGEIAPAPRFIEHRITLDLGGSQDVGPIVVEETLPELLPYRMGSSMLNLQKLEDPEITRTDAGVRMRWTLPGLEAGTQAKLSFLTEVGDMPGVFDLAGETRFHLTEENQWSDTAQWRADVLWDTKESGRQRTVDQRLLRFPAGSTALNDAMRKRLAEIAADANERDVVRIDVIGLVDQDELTEGRHPNASELTDGRIEVVRAELNRRLNLDRTLVRAFPVGVPNDERGQGGSVRIRLHTVVSALAGGDSGSDEPAPSAVAMALESDGGNTTRVGPGVGRVKFPNGGT